MFLTEEEEPLELEVVPEEKEDGAERSFFSWEAVKEI